MPTRRFLSTTDQVGRTIAARRQLTARASSAPESRGKDLEEPMATLGQEHDRAERRLGAALAEQHRSSDRLESAVGGFARLHAAIGLHAADQEVAARKAWLRWVSDDRYRGLNAGPFELRAGRSRS
jgi:hypothetical protein